MVSTFENLMGESPNAETPPNKEKGGAFDELAALFKDEDGSSDELAGSSSKEGMLDRLRARIKKIFRKAEAKKNEAQAEKTLSPERKNLFRRTMDWHKNLDQTREGRVKKALLHASLMGAATLTTAAFLGYIPLSATGMLTSLGLRTGISGLTTTAVVYSQSDQANLIEKKGWKEKLKGEINVQNAVAVVGLGATFFLTAGLLPFAIAGTGFALSKGYNWFIDKKIQEIKEKSENDPKWFRRQKHSVNAVITFLTGLSSMGVAHANAVEAAQQEKVEVVTTPRPLAHDVEHRIHELRYGNHPQHLEEKALIEKALIEKANTIGFPPPVPEMKVESEHTAPAPAQTADTEKAETGTPAPGQTPSKIAPETTPSKPEPVAPATPTTIPAGTGEPAPATDTTASAETKAPTSVETKVEPLNPHAVAGQGGGPERAFIEQIRHNPELAKDLGYKGADNDAHALNEFAKGEAHRLALRYGYVDGNGHEIRAYSPAEAFQLRKEGDVYVVDERRSDLFSKHILETHRGPEAFETEPDEHEYSYPHNADDHPAGSGSHLQSGSLAEADSGNTKDNAGAPSEIKHSDQTKITEASPDKVASITEKDTENTGERPENSQTIPRVLTAEQSQAMEKTAEHNFDFLKNLAEREEMGEGGLLDLLQSENISAERALNDYQYYSNNPQLAPSSPTYQALINLIGTLKEETGETPFGETLLQTAEKIGPFIERCMEKAAAESKLDRIRL